MAGHDAATSRWNDTPEEQEAPHYVLQLFVAGTTPRSLNAVENLRRVCEEYIPGQYELRVIDIYRMPEMAEIGQVIAAPTLVKELPLPLRRIVGDLADEGRVLLALGIRTGG
jgi:circadian clock protein KaiB